VPGPPDLPADRPDRPDLSGDRTDRPDRPQAAGSPAAEAEPWPRGRSRHGGVDEVPLPAGVPGHLWLAGRRYVGPDPEQAMASVGASMVACLCESFEIEDRYPKYFEWLDGPAALWWPIPDLHAPPLESARPLVADLACHLDRGEGVLLHCGAGMGRAGTVAAAVLLHYGLPLEEALDQVARARPGAGPEVGAQLDLLQALALEAGSA
jgi:protein-tyrosine phosphatase